MKTILQLLVAAALALPVSAATIQYQFTVLTGGLSGTGLIEWSLLPSPGALAVTAAISDEVYTGGTAGAYTAIGDASAPPAVLGNTTGDNRVQRAISNFGSQISFLVTLDGPGVDAGALEGTTFSFSLLDDAGINPATGLADGLMAQIDMGIDPALLTINPANDRIVTSSPIPEPSTFGLAGVALFLLARLRRR